MINDTPLVRAFWQNGRAAECPVIDMHGHLGPFPGIWFPRPTVEGMVHSMDRAGVRLLCFSPHASLLCPDIGNAAAVEAVRVRPDRLRAYLSINPHYPDQIAQDVRDFDRVADVYVGIKLLADYHKVPMTDARYETALRFADERGLLVLAHTWGHSTYDGADICRKVAETYPRIRFLLGHSLHDDFEGAVRLAKDFPHVYLELTAVLDNDRGVLEMFAEAGVADRMLFGTDLPWFAPHLGIGAILSADITDEDRHQILHRNAERLLGHTLGRMPA